MNKIKKYIGTALLAGCLALSNIYPSNAAKGIVEIINGNKNITTDQKMFVSIDNDTSMLFRNRTTIGDKNQVSKFSLVDLCYNLGNGVEAVGEMQFIPGLKTEPRLGLQYFNKHKDLSLFLLGVSTLNQNPEYEVTSVVKYTPKMNDNLRLFTQAEIITNFSDDYHNFDVQRLRFGVDNNGFKYGFGVDITDQGNNKGFFISKDF